MKKIAVAILNWNGRKLLEEFLPSVVKHSQNADIILVDNNSDDDSLAFMRDVYPEIEIIETSENLGYAGGYNFALQQIKNPYVVLLNSDIEVTEGWLNAPLALLENDKNIGAVQPKIRAYKQKDHFEYAGAAGGFIDVFGYPFCRGRIFENLEKDNGQYNTEEDIFWASGACMFVRKSAFEIAGGLDASFFAHMEEIDLCWRMKNRGFKITYTPNSLVYHLGGGTLAAQSPQKTFLNFRNNLYLIFKNQPSVSMLPVIFVRLILDGVAGVKFLFAMQPLHTLAIIKAHFSFYYHSIELAQKRKFSSSKKVSGVYNRSVVLDHSLFKKKTFDVLPGKIRT